MDKVKIILMISPDKNMFMCDGGHREVIATMCGVFDVSPEIFKLFKEAVTHYENNRDAIEEKRAQKDTSLDGLLQQFNIEKPKDYNGR